MGREGFVSKRAALPIGTKQMMTRNAGVARNFIGPSSATYPPQKRGGGIVSELGGWTRSGPTQIGGSPNRPIRPDSSAHIWPRLNHLLDYPVGPFSGQWAFKRWRGRGLSRAKILFRAARAVRTFGKLQRSWSRCRGGTLRSELLPSETTRCPGRGAPEGNVHKPW
jgi:hypothetical protein